MVMTLLQRQRRIKEWHNKLSKAQTQKTTSKETTTPTTTTKTIVSGTIAPVVGGDGVIGAIIPVVTTIATTPPEPTITQPINIQQRIANIERNKLIKQNIQTKRQYLDDIQQSNLSPEEKLKEKRDILLSPFIRPTLPPIATIIKQGGTQTETSDEKGTTTIVYTPSETTQEKYAADVKQYEKYRYRKTGVVPEFVASQIDLPGEFSSAKNVEGIESSYEKTAYENWLGIPSSKSKRDFSNKLLSSYEYVSTAPIWTTQEVKAKEPWNILSGFETIETTKTWNELKKDEPALYLQQTGVSATSEGVWQPIMDVKRWSREAESGLGWIEKGALIASEVYLNIYDIDAWTAEDKEQYRAMKRYNTYKGVSSGNVIGTWANLQVPAYTNVILPLAGGFAFGKITAGISGALAARSGPGAVKLFNYAQIGIGGAMAAPAAIDIGQTFYSGDINKGLIKTGVLGMQFGLGYTGYKSGSSAQIGYGQYKGLNAYEKGFLKNVDKSKWMNPLQKEMTKSWFSDVQQEMMKFNLKQKNLINIPSNEPSFTNVRSFQRGGFNQYKKSYVRGVKNIVRDVRRSEIYGGSVIDKPSTGDIDLAFKSAKNPVELNYIAKKLGVEPSDIHKMLSVGERTEFLGATKLVSVKTPSGLKRIDYVDQAMRIGQGSVILEHKGRAKDLLEAIREVDLIFNRAYPEGIPTTIKAKLTRFKEIYTRAAKNPEILIAKNPKAIYGSGKIWEWQQKFYEKILSENYLQNKAVKYTEMPREYFKGKMGGPAGKRKPYDPIARLISSLPDANRISPTISSSLRSPSSMGGFSSAFWNLGKRSSVISSSVKSPSFSSPSVSSSVKSPSISSPSVSSSVKSPSISSPSVSSSVKSPSFSSPSVSSSVKSPSISSPSVSSSVKSPSLPSSSYYTPYFPSTKISGYGTQGWGFNYKKEKYSFRKAKMPKNPFDIKNIEVKI